MDVTPIQHDDCYGAFGHPVDRNPCIREYKYRKTCQVYQRAVRLLPFSNWVKDSLVLDYQVDPQRIEVIPPGVDLGQWRPDHQSHRGPVRILFVGGDFYRKGGDTLLAAFRRLPPGLAELILVTKSTLPAEEGITIFSHLRPNTPELISLYQAADIFVLPTRAEGFGIAAVEASAAGLPVISTRVGAIAEIVVEGETGFVIPPDDPHALAQILLRLVENPDLRFRLGQAGRRHAEAHFDGVKNAARTAHCLAAAACP
jgi:glycosyltransferase involved in cell wall biosynthesis